MSKPPAKIPRIVYCRFVNSPITKSSEQAGAHRAGVYLQTPDIVFSEWYAWDDVKSIPNGHRPGIYIIAQFKQKPDGIAQPDVREVLYIGETHGKSQSIRKRLQKFFKASQVGEKVFKHSGGNRFNRLMGNNTTNLYAAGFVPILEDERFINPFIFYIERKLIWDYIVKWGSIPACNGY